MSSFGKEIKNMHQVNVWKSEVFDAGYFEQFVKQVIEM